MMNIRSAWLALAVIGAVVPWYFFAMHLLDAGAAPGVFIGAVFATQPASGFAADLLISSLVFWLLLFAERRRGGPAPWPFIALNLAIGLSCALPAWLWARHRSEEDS